MRYFDPSLRPGVIDAVKVTQLSGDDWTPGPVKLHRSDRRWERCRSTHHCVAGDVPVAADVGRFCFPVTKLTSAMTATTSGS